MLQQEEKEKDNQPEIEKEISNALVPMISNSDNSDTDEVRAVALDMM